MSRTQLIVSTAPAAAQSTAKRSADASRLRVPTLKMTRSVLKEYYIVHSKEYQQLGAP